MPEADSGRPLVEVEDLLAVHAVSRRGALSLRRGVWFGCPVGATECFLTSWFTPSSERTFDFWDTTANLAAYARSPQGFMIEKCLKSAADVGP